MTRAARQRRAAMAVVFAVLITAVSACGATPAAEPQASSSTGEVTVGLDGVQSITLASGDDYRFVPSEFTVTPGMIRVTLENAATQLTHSLAYPLGRGPADISESIPVVAPTESDTISFTVSTPGEYAFICSFHEAQGHTGVMTVEA